MIDQILGWAATIIFSAMMIPQIIKTLKTKSVDNVSLALFIMFLIGNIIAICYAYLIEQKPLIIKYLLAIGTTIFYLVVYFKTKYKK
ncbi:MAG: hypothetical protein HW421_3614 [Ignavibacteria bacterium]|nr:hypothetical protein [Ignavibacteria bacterium]